MLGAPTGNEGPTTRWGSICRRARLRSKFKVEARVDAALSSDQFPPEFVLERNPRQGVFDEFGIRNDACASLGGVDERLPNASRDAPVISGKEAGGLRRVDDGPASKQRGSIAAFPG